MTYPAGSDSQSLIWEVVLTFFLMLVIVAVAPDTQAVGQAIAIGVTVALGALVRGPILGASMNPGRSIGPAVVSGDLSSPGISCPRSDRRLAS